MDCPYREHADPVASRRDRFAERRRRALARIGPELCAIRGRRLARLVAGVTAAACVAIVFAVSVHAMVSHGRITIVADGTLTVLLLSGWGAVLLSWALVRATALGVAAATAVLPFPGTALAVAVTGALPAPLLFAMARSIALRERGVLGVTAMPEEAEPVRSLASGG